MGVKSYISLDELHKLFPSYRFRELIPTTSGIIDTTYIVHSKTQSYILKKYEREMGEKIYQDKKLLGELHTHGLNVPLYVDESNGWHLYEKLQGSEPKVIKTYHIQALARFLATLHKASYKKSCSTSLVDKSEIQKLLNYTKHNFYAYYKKFSPLQNYCEKNDGLIHGDIFKDNTVFVSSHIGVFDFIDAASGSFAFDAGVALLGFDAKKHKHYYSNLFLNTYNQHAPQKLETKELLKAMQTASIFYALKRIERFKSTSSAKELTQYIGTKY